jgi:hypothetical protein
VINETILNVAMDGLNSLFFVQRKESLCLQEIGATAFNCLVHDFFISIDILFLFDVTLQFIECFIYESDLSVFI